MAKSTGKRERISKVLSDKCQAASAVVRGTEAESASKAQSIRRSGKMRNQYTKNKMCKEEAKNLMGAGCEEHRVQETLPCSKETQPHWKAMWGGGETKT